MLSHIREDAKTTNAPLQQQGFSRTNNHQEAWHIRFNEIVGRCHVGFFLTVKEFIKEQHRTEQELNRIEHGKKTTKPVTRPVRMRENRITSLFEQREELGMDTYIRRMARNMGLGTISTNQGAQKQDNNADEEVEEVPDTAAEKKGKASSSTETSSIDD